MTFIQKLYNSMEFQLLHSQNTSQSMNININIINIKINPLKAIKIHPNPIWFQVHMGVKTRINDQQWSMKTAECVENTFCSLGTCKDMQLSPILLILPKSIKFQLNHTKSIKTIGNPSKPTQIARTCIKITSASARRELFIFTYTLFVRFTCLIP